MEDTGGFIEIQDQDDLKALNQSLRSLTPGDFKYVPPARTLRDEFAMAALQSLIAMDTEETIQRIRSANLDPVQVQCETAYKFADAMMKAREGK
jgi:hypothetical protein